MSDYLRFFILLAAGWINIHWMFEQYASGRYSIRTIEVMLAIRGLTTRKGSRAHRSSVAQMLKNPFYTGSFRWNGKLYQGNHLAIIDKELFDRVQAAFARRNELAQMPTVLPTRAY